MVADGEARVRRDRARRNRLDSEVRLRLVQRQAAPALGLLLERQYECLRA